MKSTPFSVVFLSALALAAGPAPQSAPPAGAPAPHAAPHAKPQPDAGGTSGAPFRDAQLPDANSRPGGGRPQPAAGKAAGAANAPGGSNSVVPGGATARAPDAAPSAPVEPWTATLAEGLAEVRRRAEAKDAEGARAVCERLLAPTNFLRWKEDALAAGGWRRPVARVAEPVLEFLGAEPLGAPARGEVRFASGVVAAGAGDGRAAEYAFSSAQALAGPGELRLASGYQLATTALLEAEVARLAIPEIQQKLAGGPGAANTPGAPSPAAIPGASPGAGAGGDPKAPDPLQVARAAYLRARGLFVERLRADWRDADARANTELVLKRLKELDELERQREEEKKKQDEQKNQDPKQEQDSKDKQDQKDKSKQDQDSKPKDGQENQDQNQPKPDEKQDPEKREDQPKPSEDEKRDGKEAEAQPGEARELSKEEMTRLLDLLKQREQQWKKLQQQLHQARRAKVKKDW